MSGDDGQEKDEKCDRSRYKHHFRKMNYSITSKVSIVTEISDEIWQHTHTA